VSSPVWWCAHTRALDPRSLEGPVRRTLAALDPEQPVLNVRTMADYVAAGGATRRFGLFLTSVFAGAALGLAAVGLYGVLAYLVSQRTRELGVRTALGARRVDVMRLVVGSGLKLTSLGICCGLVGAVLATPLLAAHVYGVSAGDPLTLAAVALLLMAVATGAAAAPAFRAARVSPAESLRSD
jgi:ABC-type antimicrobial peptide transport system permease subunit